MQSYKIALSLHPVISIRLKKKVLRYLHVLLAASLAISLSGCSSLRFVPEGRAVLSSVKVSSDAKYPRVADYRNYVGQEPNSKWFNVVKVPLGIYCLQGRDSTKRLSRFFRKLGEAPVVFDSAQTRQSIRAIEAALQAHGYLHASVTTQATENNGHIKLHYRMHPGTRYYIGELERNFDDERVEEIVKADSDGVRIRRGSPFDINLLEEERGRVVRLLRSKGYYMVNNAFVSFSADTVASDYGVRLSMNFECPKGVAAADAYRIYRWGTVTLNDDIRAEDKADTTYSDKMIIRYQGKPKLFRKVYGNHSFVVPDSSYRDGDVSATYSSLGSLSAVDFVSLRTNVSDTVSGKVDCEINVKLNQPHNITAEVEGTNTAGNLGAAVVLGYNDRNLFRGSEALSVKLRGAYEAITGLEGYNNQNYIEYSAEVGLRFPSFLMPAVSKKRLKHLKASSEVSLVYVSQDRPEFHRRVLTGAWTYRWLPTARTGRQHRLDLLSLNYIFMPWISDTFRKDYLEGDDPHYAVLRYSYENLFIMKTAYSFVYNSLKGQSSGNLYQTNGYQLRLGAEIAGNVLYAASKLLGSSTDAVGRYNIFNVAYSQYVKFDFDYAKSIVINDRNSLAVHTAFGIAYPYGNSDVLPYEKRYFSGGANSVRGWGVRELGPGSYSGRDGKIDFINQTGDLKLDLSVEYRTFLFWKLHGAAFIDAGNVWTLRSYLEQPGGQFAFRSFYKQIAVAYGLGLRLNFDYFILRLDGGMKAVNPSFEGTDKYPIIHPKFNRDFTFHFAVGLPF